MAVKFQLRRDTAANWAAENTILDIGEPGVETDTRKLKIGDGSTGWNALSYTIIQEFSELTNKPTTISTAQGNKLGFISVTQAVNLDTIESNTCIYRGFFSYFVILVTNNVKHLENEFVYRRFNITFFNQCF